MSRRRRRPVTVVIVRRSRRRRHDNGGRHAIDVDIGDGLALLAAFTIAISAAFRRHCHRHRRSRWADSTRPDASTARGGRGTGRSRDAGGVVGGSRVQRSGQPGTVVGRAAVGIDGSRAGHKGGLGDGLGDGRLSARRIWVATVGRNRRSSGQWRSRRRSVLGRSSGLQRCSRMLREGQGRPEQG